MWPRSSEDESIAHIMALTSRHLRRLIPFLGCAVSIACDRIADPATTPPVASPTPRAIPADFAGRLREVQARIPVVLEKNLKTFETTGGTVRGFGAGDVYPQIWLRDSAWIVDAAAALYPPDVLTSWLDLHLARAEKNGRLRDWVAHGSAEAFRPWAPRVQEKDGIAFDTNTNESDQEPSAALAFCRADRAGANTDPVARKQRMSGVSRAMTALLRDRTDPATGLIWSGLTADWGDVNPFHPDQNAIYFSEKSPRTLALYSNVIAYAALRCLGERGDASARTRAVKLRDAIRKRFWADDLGYFRMRITFDPLPAGFEGDATRFALGGNALAALHDVADDAQAASIFGTAERLRLAEKAPTISTTLIPPYAAGVFLHPLMSEPGLYQNGGEWDWFGAALVEAEFARGHEEQARRHLDQIVTRILRAGPGIHEWYSRAGEPKGSGAYAAAAASLHGAIKRGLCLEPQGDAARDALRDVASVCGWTTPVAAQGLRPAER